MAASPLPAFPQPQRSSRLPDAAQLGTGWGRQNPPAECQRHSSSPSLLLILGRGILVPQGDLGAISHPPHLSHRGAVSPLAQAGQGRGLPSCPPCGAARGNLHLAPRVGVDVQSGSSRASDEFQVDGLISHQDNAGHRFHFHTTGVWPHLKRLDHLWGQGGCRQCLGDSLESLSQLMARYPKGGDPYLPWQGPGAFPAQQCGVQHTHEPRSQRGWS